MLIIVNQPPPLLSTIDIKCICKLWSPGCELRNSSHCRREDYLVTKQFPHHKGWISSEATWNPADLPWLLTHWEQWVQGYPERPRLALTSQVCSPSARLFHKLEHPFLCSPRHLSDLEVSTGHQWEAEEDPSWALLETIWLLNKLEQGLANFFYKAPGR